MPLDNSLCKITTKNKLFVWLQMIHLKPLLSPRLLVDFHSEQNKQHHNRDPLTLFSPLCPLLAFQFVSGTNTHTHKQAISDEWFFGAESCGKTQVSPSAILHCWVWTNDVTTAARVAQWQTAYSATSSVAAPQGPGSDLFPVLHLSLSLTPSPPSGFSLSLIVPLFWLS